MVGEKEGKWKEIKETEVIAFLARPRCHQNAGR